MRKILASLLAGGLLVGAAVTTALLAGGSASAQEGDVSSTDATSTTVATTDHPYRRGAVLGGVLADLVESETITQEQSDAIVAALKEKLDEIRQDFPAAGVGRFRLGMRVGALLDDGVITADELSALPDGSILKDRDGPAAPYLADGQITADEFRSLMQDLREAWQAQHDQVWGQTG